MALTVSTPDPQDAATPRLSVGAATAVGVLSVGAALAAGHLVAGFVGPPASPFLAVGNSAIDMTPLWLKNFAVETFGTHDKQVLLGGMAVGVLLGALGGGVLSRGRPWAGGVRARLIGLLGFFSLRWRLRPGPL